MHELVIIAEIQDIKPIEGKDRIELATVSNYKSIIPKGDFKEGDSVVYCLYDTCLPEEEKYEFLRGKCYNSRIKMFRIRPMKLGGIISEGLVLPLTVLPEDKRDLKVGTDVTDIIGAKNYEELISTETPSSTPQKKKWWMRYKILRKIFGKRQISYEYPCPKSDEENIEKIWDDIKDSDILFYRSTKKEGSASTYCIRKGKLLSFSHNIYNGGGIWGKVGSIYNMKDGLKKVNKKFKSSIAIQGEICGPGIQKNIYGYSDLKFFLYGAYDIKTGRRLNIDELHEIASIMNVPEVEYLDQKYILPTVEAMLDDCVRPCKENPNTPYEEGIVWRNYDGSIHFKCKSRPYKVWFS